MSSSNATGKIRRFGVFEVDLQEALLSKAGRRIRLQDQPFRILALLIERPGQLVTREEIQQALWSNDTFVDFDDGLNTAIRKLRNALGDSAENPRFIETVPRRGYRFLAPVTEVATPGSGSFPVVAATEPPAAESVETVEEPEEVTPVVESNPAQEKRSMSNRWIWISAIAALALVAGGIYAYRRHSSLQITAKDTIVLADFSNTTGDPVFDHALKQGLTIGLEQSPSMNVLSDRKVAATLKMMSRAADEALTQPIALEVCQRSAGKVVMAGSIANLGTQYLLGLAALRCDTGDPITHEQAEVKRKEDVVEALGEVATRVRAALGESMASIQRFDAPLEQATTPSLEALKAYSLGLSTWDKKGDEATVPFLKRAVELDPNFAMAYAALGTIYHNLNDPTLASENMSKAYQLREHQTDYEKLSIESRYYRYVLGDDDKAAQSYELLSQTYPDSSGAFANLGSVTSELGQYEKAAGSYRQAIAIDPTRSSTHGNLALMYLALGNPEQSMAQLADAEKRGMRSDYLIQVSYWNAFFRRDNNAMQQLLLHASDTPGAQSLLIAAQANTEAFQGHFVKSREMARVAAELMQHDGDKEAAADSLAEAALREVEVGNTGKAREYADEAIKLAPTQDVKVLSAVAYASAGDSAKAQVAAQELNQQYPYHTFIQGYWLPVIRAKIALRSGNWQKALNELVKTSRFELAWPTCISIATLYPAYLRGQAYLAGSQGENAATEFRKLIDHPGLVLNFPLESVAHLQLGRAYAVAKNKEQSRQEYQAFLALWKDADPDIPIYQQAKAEYGRLQ